VTIHRDDFIADEPARQLGRAAARDVHDTKAIGLDGNAEPAQVPRKRRFGEPAVRDQPKASPRSPSSGGSDEVRESRVGRDIRGIPLVEHLARYVADLDAPICNVESEVVALH